MGRKPYHVDGSEIRRSPVEVGSWHPINKQGFSTIQTVVFSPDFWLPSTVCLWKDSNSKSSYIPYHPCMVYTSTFGGVLWVSCIGKYTIYPMDPMPWCRNPWQTPPLWDPGGVDKKGTERVFFPHQSPVISSVHASFCVFNENIWKYIRDYIFIHIR